MFQCISNCCRGWAQCSNAIVTDLAFNVYWVPYGRYSGSAEVREDQSGAVELRARQVPTEYRRNAREKDQQSGPAGSTLIQDRVASFGACRAVVFGNYGEASRRRATCTR